MRSAPRPCRTARPLSSRSNAPPPILERKHAVDRRQQPAGAQLVDDRLELGVVAHRRSQERPLIPEQPANVGLAPSARTCRRMSRAVRAGRARGATAPTSLRRRCRRRRPCPASPVRSRITFATSHRSWLSNSSAPSAAARVELVVARRRRPRRARRCSLQICSAASATPPPIPRSARPRPPRTRARRHDHAPRRERRERERGGLLRRHRARNTCARSSPGTTTYSAIVPGRARRGCR